MDEADQAQEYQARLNADAAGRRSRPAGPAATHCGDCGQVIPEARRQAIPGCCRCVWCQEAVERQRGRECLT